MKWASCSGLATATRRALHRSMTLCWTLTMPPQVGNNQEKKKEGPRGMQRAKRGQRNFPIFRTFIKIRNCPPSSYNSQPCCSPEKLNTCVSSPGCRQFEKQQHMWMFPLCFLSRKNIQDIHLIARNIIFSPEKWLKVHHSGFFNCLHITVLLNYLNTQKWQNHLSFVYTVTSNIVNDMLSFIFTIIKIFMTFSSFYTPSIIVHSCHLYIGGHKLCKKAFLLTNLVLTYANVMLMFFFSYTQSLTNYFSCSCYYWGVGSSCSFICWKQIKVINKWKFKKNTLKKTKVRFEKWLTATTNKTWTKK